MANEDDDRTFVTPQADPPSATAPVLADRYEDLGRIGVGGSGEVRRVRDRSLDRHVAMKILPAGSSAVFEREARLTARLQHPGIVPVHDFGELPDGRIWFTMREVRGSTLSERILEVHAAADREWGTTSDGWTLRRLVGALQAVAEVVAYAHSEGVVHCDLKPSNVMIGPFGEVQVLDWGIARAQGSPDHGPVRGTPGYLAPEVARGALPTAASDVWSLGVVLYRVLTGRRPFPDLDGTAVLLALRTAAPPPPRASPGRPTLPDELVDQCNRAMAFRPADRPTALGFADGLRSWLDGARDRARAQELSEGGESERTRARELRTRASDLRAGAERLLADVAPHDPVDRKRPGWDQLDQADGLEREAEVAEVRFVETQRAALELAPHLDEAHRRLAHHFRDRLANAEAGRRVAEAARYEHLLRVHDRGDHAAWLRGDAELEVSSEPSGARVVAEPYELRDRRLVPGSPRDLGVTPLRVGLPHGSWRLRLIADGRAEVVCPVLLDRAGTWDRTPPEGGDPVPVWLPPAGELGADECYVPAGWFGAGGDPEAPDALPERRLWVDGFAIGRFPVTHARYRDFLRDLPVDRRAGLLPAYEVDGVPVYRVDGDGVELGMFEGRPLDPDEPVTLVDWRSAAAFCSWLAGRRGRPYRLPHDLEWEKAARGVDRRVFPWGPHLDPTWARMQRSTPDAPGPARVGDHPEDESPYGVRGLGGNVRDWCANGYRRHGPAGDRVDPDGASDVGEALRCIRGGSWHSGALFCRSAGRLVGPPELRRHVFGFRVCRTVGSAAVSAGGAGASPPLRA